MKVSENHAIRFGDFEFDPVSGALVLAGTTVKLQHQSAQILSALLQHPGELVTREELRKLLWPEHTYVDFEQGLNSAVKKLRKALGDEASTPKFIETIPRRGYRYIGEALIQTEEESRSEHVAPPVSVNHVDPPRRFRWVLLSIAFVLLLVTYRSAFPKPPVVVATRQITHDHTYKLTQAYWFCNIVADDSRIYFQERVLAWKWKLFQVSVHGGEITEIPTYWSDAGTFNFEGEPPCLLAKLPNSEELLVFDKGWWAVSVQAVRRDASISHLLRLVAASGFQNSYTVKTRSKSKASGIPRLTNIGRLSLDMTSTAPEASAYRLVVTRSGGPP